MATTPPETTQARPAAYIDPATLMRISSLELRARTVVEGLMTGLNRSPYHGFSVEFSEYRQYSPGDDPRYLDWKLYARSDRYYVKRFEDETNLRCHLLLDMSRSMSFGSLDYTKIDYARTLVATLGYFLVTQRDAVGLATFDEHVEDFIPARYRVGQLRRLMVALERRTGGRATNLAQPLEQVAERVRKRGLVILISDLLAPAEMLEKQLGYLRARGHELLVFQVLDPAEITFAFDEAALFQDLETGQEFYVDPQAARSRYLEQFEQHVEAIRASCEKLGVTYRRYATDEPLERALAEFLHERMKSASSHVPRRRVPGRVS